MTTAETQTPILRRYPLLGIMGRKRSGKDTFARALGCQRVGFADALKRAALRANPIIVGPDVRLAAIVDREGWESAKTIPEVRRFLQEYGIGIRDVDPDFWVRVGMDAANEARQHGPVAITDVRFPNEHRAVEDAGGLIIRIDRDAAAPDPNDSTASHVSETGWQDLHAFITVHNNGLEEDLRAAAKTISEGLRLHHPFEVF